MKRWGFGGNDARELQADVQIFEHLGERNCLQRAEGVVPCQAVACYSGTRDAAEESCELALCAQGGMAFGAQFGDDLDISLADVGISSFWQRRRLVSLASAAVPAVGVCFFAKVVEESSDGAPRCGGKLDNSIKAAQVLFFSGGEKAMQPSCDLVRISFLGPGKEAESVTKAGRLDLDITRLLKIAQGFENAFAGFADFFGGGIRFDGEESRAAFSRGKEALQEFLPLGFVSRDDAILWVSKGDL